MATVTVIDTAGTAHTLAGRTGDSVMQLARAADLPVLGECNGSLACATCHVIVDPAWADRIPPIGEDEEAMLDTVFSLTATSRLTPTQTGVPHMSEKVLISPAELAAMIPSPDVVVIDTRSPDNYAAGHIAGAVNLFDVFTVLATSTSTSTPEGVAELRQKFADRFGAAGLSGAETAVFIEDSMNSGFGMSCRGYFLMQFLGYPKAQVVHGGLTAWKAAGFPVTIDVPSVTPKLFPVVDTGQDIIINAQTMLESLKDDGVIKMDVRDADEWVGTSSSPYGPDFAPRRGRIPGARWLEWYRMMKPSAAGPMFKSKDEILAECATIGVTPETPVFLYCFMGARASNTLVALKEAGIKDVRMYFGSWNEWSRDPSLPIESGLPFAKP